MKPSDPDFIKKLQFNENGLIPAIAQDWLDGAVLMMAWMNKGSLEKTMKTGEVHYWSRSRQELWHKGGTSGHTQILKELRFDCDKDAILLIVEQTGGIACHKGKRSCFYESTEINSQGQSTYLPPATDACSDLFRVIKQRQNNPEPNSYTNKLLAGGDNQILKKIGEESAELVMACKDDDPVSISNEAADLIFHLQVALADHQVNWEEVLKVLASRRNAPRRP